MRIAILADIHGNGVALRAVLKDLARQGMVDQIIVAGDFFAPGSETTMILDLLQKLHQVYFLRGNADRYLLEGSYTTVYNTKGWQGRLQQAFHWTAEQLSQTEWQFLSVLPFSQQVEVGARKVLAVHGSPQSDEEGLTTDTRPDDVEQMLADSRITLLCCGHTHVPMDNIINGVRVVNVGSVGLPFDGDPRASYAIISNLGAARLSDISVELRRVTYNTEQAVQRLYAVNHPAAELGAYNIRYGRPKGSTVYPINMEDASSVTG